MTVERERPILERGPVPVGRPERRDGSGATGAIARATRIEAGGLRHAVFVFVVALPLDPLVRAAEHGPLGRARIPRGLAVAYLGVAGAVALAIVVLATVVVDQTRAASDRVEAYLTVERGRNDLHAPRFCASA